jgi:hypothetical protein
MFGNHNDQQQDNGAIPDHSIDGVMNSDSGQQQDSPQPNNWGHPGTPLDQSQPNDQPNGSDQPEPAVVEPEHHEEHHDQPATEEHHDAAPVSGGDDLLQIKQQALGQLSPLVGHLDQSPEEKFRTTMMMLQATDDKGLVQMAFDAAQKIEDEKTRAQALLDVINEINYFTQPKN